MLKPVFARLLSKFPRISAAIMSGVPYIGTDLWVGDTPDISAAPVTPGFPVPSPLSTHVLTVGGVVKGDPASYTVVSGDIGHATTDTQTSANGYVVSATSAAVTPIAALKAWDLGYLGGNSSAPASSTSLQVLNNAGQAGRLPFYVYNNTSSTYAGSLDANGWPTAAFSYLITATSGGLDGQLPAGTYNGSFRSVGQATTMTVTAGTLVSTSLTNPNTGINDGVTTYFTITNPAASNLVLNFSGAVQYVDIPRDGVTYTYGGPEFWDTNLAFFSQQSVVRWMDLCNAVNSTEVLWSDRNTVRPEYGVTAPSNGGTLGAAYSWERLFRYAKALLQYPGSRLQTLWINPPGLIDPTVANADNYAYQLPTLMNTALAGLSVQVMVELGDEPWNASLGGTGMIFAANVNKAISEIHMLPWYVSFTNNVSSIVGNGDGTVTVTLTTASLSNIPLPDGSTFTITNGMALVVNHQTLNSTWGAGSITPDPNYAADGTVVSVAVTTGGALAANQFKYTANGTPSGTLAAPSGSNQLAMFFNLASNLIKDGTSVNLFSIGTKVNVRRTFQAAQVWHTVRPQDRFVLNLQQYGQTPSAGGMTTSPVSFTYGKYIGGGSLSWLYGTAEAPYVFATGLPFGTATSGTTFVTGVAFAATAVVGDQVKIQGAGPAGATLTTTVAAGSSGTTLNITDTISTTALGANSGGTNIISYVYGPSTTVTASIDGTTGVMTVTAGSGLMVGMMGNGTPVNLAFNTRIQSQLTGTTGGAGTYQLSMPQATIASTSISFAQTDGLVAAMISSIPIFAEVLAAHVYTNLRWGLVPLVYEGGPDNEAMPNQQIAIQTNPAMQTLVTNLLDVSFNQGIKLFCFYSWAPIRYNNSTQGEWAALQSYADTASPKHAGLAGYATRQLAYADAVSPGLTFGPSGSAGAYVEGLSQLKNGWQGFNATTGMLYCSGSTIDRTLEILRCLPRGRRFGIKVTGSDSAAGTLADIYIDGVLKGTVTMANNGTGASNGTVPGDSTVLQLGELTRGAHRVMVDFPVGRGTNVGIFGITLVKY